MAIDLKKLFGGFFEEILSEVIGAFLLVTLGKKMVGNGTHDGEQGGQRMPHAFGIGQDDEAIFGSLRQLMNATKRPFVDLVLTVMEKHEKVLFRITLAKMSCGGESFDEPVKNPQKGQPATVKKRHSWESTKQDLRVKYLNDLADEVIQDGGDEKAARKVVAAMRAQDLITRSWFAEKVHQTWTEACRWVETEMVDFFEVDSPEDITPQMVNHFIAVHINRLTTKIPAQRLADVNIGFWRGNFRRAPVSTIAFAVCIIGLLGWSIFNANH